MSGDENPTREHAAGAGSPAIRHAVTTGAVFSKRYKLIRRISAGGMAEVYEVEHLGTRRRLALKLLLPEVMADAASVERFQREATVCANIDSDHIVNVIDTDVDADTGMPFLVMELLNGKDLSQYIAETWGRGAPIPPSLVLTLMRQVASALDKVHAQGIVHRDLKPANLFLTFPSDGPPRVKILDFGVAKLTREKRTSNATRLGTPLYMSPEQLTGNAEPTAATDVWALALIVYELFVGAPYWEGNTASSLIERIPDAAQHPKASVLAAARGVALGPSFDRWLLRCIDPDAAKRPATAGEAIGDLLRLFDPSATQPPTRAAVAPVAPAARELVDTHRDALQTVQMPAIQPRSLPRPAPPAPKRAPGLTPTPPRASAILDSPDTPAEGSERPTIPAQGRQVMARVRPVTPKAADAAERPTMPNTGRQVVARVRDAGEAKTIKMATVRFPDAKSASGVRPPMDTVPIPLARPATHETSGDGHRLGPMETRPIPLERPIVPAAAHAPYTLPPRPKTPPRATTPSRPAPASTPQAPLVAASQPAPALPSRPSPPTPPPTPPSATTSSRPAAPPVAAPPVAAPVVTPAAPPAAPPPVAEVAPPQPATASQQGDLLAQRISQAAEESESASLLLPTRRPDPHALTTVLPVVSMKPTQGVSMTTIGIAGALSLGLTIAAGYVLLHRRVAAVVEPPPAAVVAPPAPGLAATDRATLRACASSWSASLLARQNPDGGFGATAGAPSSGLDTARVFVALLRGHIAGAIVAPERQLQVLRALDEARMARGWGPATSGATPRSATTTATAWTTIAYSLMAEESRAETARARVRIARDALLAAQRPDGSFSDDMLPAAPAASDVATVLATWALVEARRADPGTDAHAAPARARATTWVGMRVMSGALPTGLDALAFWTLWQARAADPTVRAEVDAVAVEFARSLLARCPAARGCPSDVPSWEPWTALSVASLLSAAPGDAPPPALDAPTRAALSSLLALTLARYAGARGAVAASPSDALATWLFSAGELQR